VVGENPHVGEIRHIGLIHALKLVKNRQDKSEFSLGKRIGHRIYKK
jgi:adenosylmethionine-8-amino-7-oxononanoate aminotransferase